MYNAASTFFEIDPEPVLMLGTDTPAPPPGRASTGPPACSKTGPGANVSTTSLSLAEPTAATYIWI